MMRKLKPKRCRQCKEEFIPWNSTQVCCDYQCAIEYVKEKQEKNLQRDIDKAKQAERREIKRRKEKLKSKSDWLKEAQAACNTYIRERDKDEPCISCGRYDYEINGYLTGGKWDAGHFKSRGGFPELRFQPFNVHKQCKSCNGGSDKYARKNRVVSSEYKERLIRRIGIDMVTWLEGPHEAQNLTVLDIKEIKEYYKEQLKILKSS